MELKIIRCKNCEYCLEWNDGSITCTHWTDQWDMSTELEGFCSFGKLKEGCEVETYEAVRHGHWELKDETHVENIYTCSCCHNNEAWGETEKTRYCSYCGARMNLSGEDNV